MICEIAIKGLAVFAVLVFSVSDFIAIENLTKINRDEKVLIVRLYQIIDAQNTGIKGLNYQAESLRHQSEQNKDGNDFDRCRQIPQGK